MKLKANQIGAAHLVAILLVIVTAAVGVVGWKVWDNSKNKSRSTNPQTTSNSKVSTEDESTPISDKAYLEIKELGLKVKLNDDTRDLTYYLEKNGAAILSSSSLAKEEPKCAANYQNPKQFIFGVGAIYSYTNPDGYDIGAGGSKNSDAVKSVMVGSKYYYIMAHQMFCVNNGTKNQETDKAYQIESKLVKALRSDEVTLEKL